MKCREKRPESVQHVLVGREHARGTPALALAQYRIYLSSATFKKPLRQYEPSEVQPGVRDHVRELTLLRERGSVGIEGFGNATQLSQAACSLRVRGGPFDAVGVVAQHPFEKPQGFRDELGLASPLEVCSLDAKVLGTVVPASPRQPSLEVQSVVRCPCSAAEPVHAITHYCPKQCLKGLSLAQSNGDRPCRSFLVRSAPRATRAATTRPKSSPV